MPQATTLPSPASSSEPTMLKGALLAFVALTALTCLLGSLYVRQDVRERSEAKLPASAATMPTPHG